MNYVLKDHIGSLYATVTNGDVEYYSFDAWGRDRNHNTLQYDNISTTFDRGFCMHEHYRDFNLINMNGRLYDPLVGRMLSPDIVIQNPEYSQSYNRYSYCFNNPLRFTDPSGYVVRGRNDVLNPQYFIWLKSSNSKNGNSFNTDIVEGSPSPIYDEDGNFLGTDDEGLQGDAIVMNVNDFVQGMSHEDALALSTSLNEKNLEMAELKMKTHYSNLKNRPDWDGYLTYLEAREWWRNGNGEALYVNQSLIDLSPLSIIDFNGQNRITHNFFFDMESDKDVGRVYGTLTLHMIDHDIGEVKLGNSNSAYIDTYDFNSGGSMMRNIATRVAKIIVGNGTPFKIYGWGDNPKIHTPW